MVILDRTLTISQMAEEDEAPFVGNSASELLHAMWMTTKMTSNALVNFIFGSGHSTVRNSERV